MTTVDLKKAVKLINYAETLFKFSMAISATKRINGLDLEYYETATWGKFTVKGKKLRLSKKQAEISPQLFVHVATYILILQWDAALEELFGDKRFTHTSANISAASSIIRSIRNAFAHSPFQPRWKIKGPIFKDQSFIVTNIIKLDTHNLDGKPIDEWEYGGPPALLRLSKYLKRLIKNF